MNTAHCSYEDLQEELDSLIEQGYDGLEIVTCILLLNYYPTCSAEDQIDLLNAVFHFLAVAQESWEKGR